MLSAVICIECINVLLCFDYDVMVQAHRRQPALTDNIRLQIELIKLTVAVKS